MAVSKIAWKDYEICFVTPISDDFICSICLSLLCEPCQSSCCGHHFCKACAEEVQKSKKNNQCPLCRNTPLMVTVDLFHKRKLNQSVVHCPRKRDGCWWKGKLGKVEEHLSAGQLQGECQYVEVNCLLCHKNVMRDVLHRHMSYLCPKRTVSCEYCGTKSTYEEITKQHFDVCLNYPLFCPNHCSSDVIQRRQMSDHLNVCPEQEVACTFSKAGCGVKLLRKQLQQHLEANVITHQSLAWQAQEKEIAAMKDEVAELKLKAGQVDYWKNGFQLMAEEVKKNNWTVYISTMSKLVTSMSPRVAPIMLHMKISDSWSHSMFFYSHHRGYKMLLCARVHQTRGAKKVDEKCEGIEVHFCTMEGQYDSSLAWPYNGKANITLLNKKENANHITKTYDFIANKNSDAGRIQKEIFPPRGRVCATHHSYDRIPRPGDDQQAPVTWISVQRSPFIQTPAPLVEKSVRIIGPNRVPVQLKNPFLKDWEELPVEQPAQPECHVEGHTDHLLNQVHKNCTPVTASTTIVLSKGEADVTYSGYQCFEVTF